jgi:thiol-disulfide isomerase/thioredoxin
MKRYIFIISCLLLLSGFFSAWAQSVPGNYIVVYYFHTTLRCPTCYKIEQYTQEAVEKYFDKEIKAGTISFKAVNMEREKNQHYIKDYQLFSKAVVISMIKEGKEVKFNNLTKIWEYVRDKEKFYEYIKTETAKYLEGVK